MTPNDLTRRHLLGALALLAGAPVLAAAPTALLPAQLPAGLELPLLRQQPLSLGQLRGQLVLIDFWSTTCGICMNEMPLLAELHLAYAPRGLHTIAMALGTDRPDLLIGYAERNPLPFPLGYDYTHAVARAFGGVRVTPTLYLLDRQGRAVYGTVGAVAWTELTRQIERHLPG